jgi:hypothetical protein
VASLRDVFDALIGQPRHDPVEVLREQGFDLSAAAAADALVSYAHSAPVEVASHLQQFVMAHGPVPYAGAGGAEAVAGAGDGLGLLATAPVVVVPDRPEFDSAPDLDAPSELGGTPVLDGALGLDAHLAAAAAGTVTADEFDFGSGGMDARPTAADSDAATAEAEVDVPVPEESAPDPYHLDAGAWTVGPPSAASGDADQGGDEAGGSWDPGQF